jgi:hypothetical protein
MQVNASYSTQSYPLAAGVRYLVSLGPVNGQEHPWAYSLFVDVLAAGRLRGSVLSSSLLADYVLMHDRLAIIVAQGASVWEGVVHLDNVNQNAAEGRVYLQMSLEHLDRCNNLDQVTVPRT